MCRNFIALRQRSGDNQPPSLAKKIWSNSRTSMPILTVRALLYAISLWVIGFVWGSVVFMTPALKGIASIPYVSRYPAISFPLLFILPVAAYVCARRYLKNGNGGDEGFRLGLTFALTNLVLDLLVLVVLFSNGFAYFASITVWLAYLLLLIVPSLTGRSLAVTR